MNNKIVSWEIARNYVHDISGIKFAPSEYEYYRFKGVYYPIIK